MDSLYILIPVALVFVAGAIRLLLWAIDSGQYEDLDKEGWRILNDDSARDTSPKDRAGEDNEREKSRGPEA